MKFTKLHGTGNDFVVVDRDAVPDGSLEELAKRVCDRHRGVGADGLLVVGPREPDGAWRLVIVNADGSRASACGNGARCVARYLGEREAFLRTDAERARVTWDGAQASVTLRAPRFGRRHIVPLPPGDTAVRQVDVGNAHAIVLGLEPEGVDLAAVARAVRERLGDVNVGVVALAGPGTLRLRVDERGVGETLACGRVDLDLYLIAAAGAARVEGWIGDLAKVRLPGGELQVVLRDDTIVVSGPVVEVFCSA